MNKISSLLMLTICLTACGELSKTQNVERAQLTNDSAIVEKESEFVDASKRSIPSDTNLAAKFDDAALSLLGNPKKPINITPLIKNISADNKYFVNMQKDDSKLIDENKVLAAKVASDEAKIKDEAAKYEAEQWFSFFLKVALSGTGILIIGGLIALCVFFPPALPFILSQIPNIVSLVSFIYNSIISIIKYIVKLL